MNARPSKLPIIVLTGASGIIGRHLIKSFRDDAYIYAIARRSQNAVNVEQHKNVHWMRIDVAEQANVEQAFGHIAKNGGADFLIHLAGYYDFENTEHPEFERTNVNGTRLVLENTAQLNIKRFIFASSLTITKFKTHHDVLTETSPANADFPYAVSKKKCELMIKEYAHQFPCTIIRLAAVFSDWCEYGPLYVFLTTWLSKSWKSRILAGKGTSAIPYIHVRNLNSFLASIIRQTDNLPDYHILITSPDGYTSHFDLYKLAVHYAYGKPVKPFYIAKWLAYIGVLGQQIFGKLLKIQSFERLWMMQYIDTQMNVDASYSRKVLSWEPLPRYHIMRRLLFLIENMKANPNHWNLINFQSLHQKSTMDPNLLIYQTLLVYENEIIKESISLFHSENKRPALSRYRAISGEELGRRLSYFYRIIKIALRTGDRFHALEYAHDLAVKRFIEDFTADEVTAAIDLFGQHIIRFLSMIDELKKLDSQIYNEIIMTVRLICDEVEDTYEKVMGEI